MRRFTAVALVLCLFSPLAVAQDRRTFAIPFRSVNGVILLEAKVNGRTAVLLLDTGAQDSMMDSGSVRFDPRLGKLRSTGVAGAAGTCVVLEVDLVLEHRRWLNRKVCVLDLSDASRHFGTHIDGLIGQDVLREFSSVRIDYRNHVVELSE